MLLCRGQSLSSPHSPSGLPRMSMRCRLRQPRDRQSLMPSQGPPRTRQAMWPPQGRACQHISKVRTTSCESRTLMHVPDIVWSARHWFHSLACVRGAACPLQSTCHERYLMEGTGDPWLYMSAWPKGGKGASDTSFYGSRLHEDDCW